MASFGSFETVREVYSDPIYTVFFARKSGDPVTEYAVKVFRLPASQLEAELTGHAPSREELEKARLDSLSVQERAAANSRLIAPVLERGNDDRGVWYATRFYPRSVNKMMSGKVALPRTSLEHIISSIAQGALDFKHFSGRAHGDLRPTNIQVSKTERLTEAEVVLCDPLPGTPEQAAGYEKSDLHSIGVILLELVRQRTISAEDLAVMVPIGPSDEWVRTFGSDASDWLALCNRLLDPHLSPDHFGLEDLVARLNELKPKRRAPLKPALAGTAAVFIVALLALWLLRPRSETVEVTSDPPGATILVDEAKQSRPAPLRLKLRQGSHVLEARLDQLGLAAEATNCVVEKGKSAGIHFQFPYGSVAIQSDPPGATIFKDGVAIGKTSTAGRPFIVEVVAPGMVKYQLKLEQREPAVVTGMVVDQQRLELAATLRSALVAGGERPPSGPGTGPKTVPAARNGVLELSAQPVAATIFDAGGRALGGASADKVLSLSLAPGTYPLIARIEGLEDVPATLQVEAGSTNQHTFAFDYGMVDWTSQPVAATVSQGELSRSTPATFLQKPGTAVSYVIRAAGYQAVTNPVIVRSGERKSMPVTLTPLVLSLELVSDPPGAAFFAENGSALTPCQTNQQVYYLPWGPANLIARYPLLGSVTNHLDLKPDQGGSQVQFPFDYGTLVLTNLPPDIAVYEGDSKIGSASDKAVYQKRGAHLYALRGQGTSENVQTNILAGLNYFLVAKAQKSWKNSLGIWFAWIPNLPGGGAWPGQSEPGGWVGLTEVTQGEYKKMDGNNPSVFHDGADNYPVENLTREEAERFCHWLSSADTATRLGWHYALPTDSQFAAFAGDADHVPRVTNEGRMNNDMEELFPGQRLGTIPPAGNLNNARTHPEPVASTQANQFGLYDVVGNVSEWLAGSSTKDNVYAGGSYLNFSSRTVGTRAREKVKAKGPNIGFRLVLIPPQ
jgi:hypothetical protein